MAKSFIIFVCILHLKLSHIESGSYNLDEDKNVTHHEDEIINMALSSTLASGGGKLVELVHQIYMNKSRRCFDFLLGQDNPDINLNIVQLLTKYGHTVATYEVETEDGYLLTVYRIKGGRDPVFLMHGLMCSADDFVTPGLESGLAYLLAAQGYDVWMGNARGTKHSRAHRWLSPDSDSDYWQFSWDEIGRFDLPAMIDLVLRVTRRSQLKYIGHSQGTTSFFVLCSMRPEYNEKISLMVALCAVAFMSNLKSPLIRLLSPINPLVAGVLQLVGNNEFFSQNILVTTLRKTLCGPAKFALIFCNTISFIVSGFDYVQVNMTNLPVLYSHAPAGAATKQLVHYGQGVVSGEFCRYDHGMFKNLLVYGSVTPPVYPLERITAPVAIFYSESDWLASTTDVFKLHGLLPNALELYKVPVEPFNHMDFLWAKDLKSLIFPRLHYLLELGISTKKLDLLVTTTNNCP